MSTDHFYNQRTGNRRTHTSPNYSVLFSLVTRAITCSGFSITGNWDWFAHPYSQRLLNRDENNYTWEGYSSPQSIETHTDWLHEHRDAFLYNHKWKGEHVCTSGQVEPTDEWDSEDASFWTCLCIPRSVVGAWSSAEWRQPHKNIKVLVPLHREPNPTFDYLMLSGDWIKVPMGWQESFLLKDLFRLLELLAKPSFWELGSLQFLFTVLNHSMVSQELKLLSEPDSQIQFASIKNILMK